MRPCFKSFSPTNCSIHQLPWQTIELFTDDLTRSSDFLFRFLLQPFLCDNTKLITGQFYQRTLRFIIVSLFASAQHVSNPSKQREWRGGDGIRWCLPFTPFPNVLCYSCNGKQVCWSSTKCSSKSDDTELGAVQKTIWRLSRYRSGSQSFASAMSYLPRGHVQTDCAVYIVTSRARAWSTS